MTDIPSNALEWFSGSADAFNLTRAERIEHLATGAPAPIRVAASVLLAIEARTAPWRLRIHHSARRVGAGTADLSERAGRVGRAAGRSASRTAGAALGVASRARTAADWFGQVADRMSTAASARLDRLAAADGRVAQRLERRLAFLHPANVLRSVQTALMVVGGLAVMAAIALTPNGRNVRVAVTAPPTASFTPPLEDPLVPSSRASVAEAAPVLAAPTHALAARIAAPAPAPIPTPAAAAKRGPLPVGKGMWLYQPQATEAGDVGQIVARARAVGLTHLYVRTGSSVDGFNAAPFLTQLLPVAHANGIRVIGWDFPYLHDVGQDVARATTAIAFATPNGQRIDGFAADVEPWSGVNLTPATAAAYSTGLRKAVGTGYPLIAVVPRPDAALTTFPFAQLLPSFDAVAPMIYWMGNDPAAATQVAFADLAPYGKPIIPVGQAYDGGPEGGTKGGPSPAEINKFIAASDQLGAIGVSFWSWQAASQPEWDTIKAAPQFVLGMLEPASMTPSQIRAYQALLSSLGYPVKLTGVFDQATLSALTSYQQAANVGLTGTLDTVTQSLLLTPVLSPLLGH